MLRQRRPGRTVTAGTAAPDLTAGLPEAEVLLASGDLDDGKLPPDTAAWLRTSAGT